MTEPSEAAKAKAEELMFGPNAALTPHRVAAYIQQVSDAADELTGWPRTHMAPFILPEPVNPAREAIGRYGLDPDWLLSKLANDGLKIVKDET